ncbi:MAG: hypothetical protein V1859_03320 [archaeon]
MKNKKKGYVIIFLLAISFAVSMIGVRGIESIPEVNVTLMNQDPDPVGPGRYVDVRFKIMNSGTTDAQNVILELVPQYPFFLDANEEATRTLGVIPGYGNSKRIMVVKYKVKIDKTAVEGENILNLRYKLGNSPWITEEYTINVQTIDATIAIDSVESVPAKLVPGDSAKIKITIKNMADSVMEDVSLKFDLGLSTVTLPATISALSLYDQVPFAPQKSATEQKVRLLSPGATHVFTYDILTYPDATPKVYKIPVQIKYRDELSNEITKNDIVGLIVGSEPDLQVTIDKTTLTKLKASGEVYIKFVNKGLENVKFLNVMLEKSDAFDLLSSNTYYIGNVDSDDYETSDFKIYVKSDMKASGDISIKLPVVYEYKDSNNNIYSKKTELDVILYDQNKLGGSNGMNPFGIIIIAVVLVIGFIFIKRRNSKKK